MVAFIKSLRFMGRARKVERRFGISKGKASIGLHFGKASGYVFYSLPKSKRFNRVYLGTF